MPVTGYRAATYSITRESLWALDILKEEGFDYDSSIFPVRHDRYGIPDAADRAAPADDAAKARTLVEYPLTAVEVLGLNIPMAGGGYFRLFPYGFTRWGLSRVRAQGRPVVFYLHPWEVDPEQPRIADAGWLSRFRHYLNLDRTLPRLDRLLADFRFCTMRECLEAEGLL